MLKASRAAAIAALVSACASQAPQSTSPASSPQPPANYREIVAAGVRETFVDPYSIRDAEIAAPKMAMGPSLNSDGFTTPWVVCVRANAKNRMGGYTGREVTAFAVNGGKVVNSWDEAHYSRAVCSDVYFQPFPEIEQGVKPAPARAATR